MVVQVCWEPPYAVVPAVASRWEVPSKCGKCLGVPYAVVPADASRWGPIVECLLWVVLGPYGHAVFPQPLVRQCVTCQCESWAPPEREWSLLVSGLLPVWRNPTPPAGRRVQPLRRSPLAQGVLPPWRSPQVQRVLPLWRSPPVRGVLPLWRFPPRRVLPLWRSPPRRMLPLWRSPHDVRCLLPPGRTASPPDLWSASV